MWYVIQMDPTMEEEKTKWGPFPSYGEAREWVDGEGLFCFEIIEENT